MFQTAKRATEKRSWKAKYSDTKETVATQHVEGQHFMRDAAERVSGEAKEIMIDTTWNELKKLWDEASYS